MIGCLGAGDPVQTFGALIGGVLVWVSVLFGGWWWCGSVSLNGKGEIWLSYIPKGPNDW